MPSEGHVPIPCRKTPGGVAMWDELFIFCKERAKILWGAVYAVQQSDDWVFTREAIARKIEKR
jgi:hypothetical protein